MKKDVRCQAFDDALETITQTKIGLEEDLRECMESDKKYKKSKSNTNFYAIIGALVCAFSLFIGHEFAVNQDVAAYLMFYPMALASGAVSLGSVYLTLNTLREIKINNKRIMRVQRQLQSNQKQRNVTMEKYNAYKKELEENFGEKIEYTEEELIDMSLNMANSNLPDFENNGKNNKSGRGR